MMMLLKELLQWSYVICIKNVIINWNGVIVSLDLM